MTIRIRLARLERALARRAGARSLALRWDAHAHCYSEDATVIPAHPCPPDTLHLTWPGQAPVRWDHTVRCWTGGQWQRATDEGTA